MTDEVREAGKLLIDKWNNRNGIYEIQTYVYKLEESLKPSKKKVADYLGTINLSKMSDNVSEETSYINHAIEYLRTT